MNTLLLILGLVPVWTEMSNAVVVQDSAITRMMEDHWEGRMHNQVDIMGWRVQIFSSNNQLVAKQQAEELKIRLENEIQQPIYIDFIQPFWKVRIGNFLTMEEAKAYREELVKQFPELQAESYPVKDHVKIKQ